MSPFCAQAGLYLASGPFSANIRHFGLQLMEHTVKFKWNCISQEEKIFIKVFVQRIIKNSRIKNDEIDDSTNLNKLVLKGKRNETIEFGSWAS